MFNLICLSYLESHFEALFQSHFCIVPLKNYFPKLPCKVTFRNYFKQLPFKQERVPFCYPHVALSTLDVRARFVFHGSAAAKSTNPLPGFCFMWFFRLLVIRYVFRKYPSRYEQVVQALCESLEVLDEPEGMASMIWIIIV